MNENQTNAVTENPVNLVNPVETTPAPSGAAEDTSHLCPPCSDVKGCRPKTGRPLSRMECLSDRQLMHINAWLDDGEPFKKLVDLCKSNFDVDIPKTTFQRYYKRSAARTLIADLADSKEACAEISKYAVTGIATFSATTLEILEQQAFDLAVAFNRDNDAEDLGTLKNLWTLIHKAKNTHIRERHATVQEQKIQLRREELALKRELAARTPNPNLNLCISDVITPSNAQVGPVVPNGPRSRDAITNSDAASADPNATPNNISANTTADSNTPAVPSASTSVDNDDTDDFDYENMPSISPNPLPPEVIARNLEFSRKLRAGKIIIDHSGPYVRAIEVSDILAANAALDRAAVPQNTEAPHTNSNPNP